jgi:hypothetical protein
MLSTGKRKMMRGSNERCLVPVLAWMICLVKAAFLKNRVDSLQGPKIRIKGSTTASVLTSTIGSNGWPPSSWMDSSASFMDTKQGIVPGLPWKFDWNHQHQQSQSVHHSPKEPLVVTQEMDWQALSRDGLAAATLRNIVHQAACDALIYDKRWRYCIAVWDDRLLDWLVEAASTGNFWTPKTYLILSTTDKARNIGVNIEEHPVWHHWEGTKAVFLSSDSDPADGVKTLRSLPTRTLPRVSDSGHRSTDIPVFDTLIITSSQLQSLLNHVESLSRVQADRSLKINHHDSCTRRKKRKSTILQNMPWVISIPCYPQPRNILSWNVLQVAKQVIVVQDTNDWNFNWSETMGGTLSNCIWLGTFPERRCWGD